jgi:hypothetical protein
MTDIKRVTLEDNRFSVEIIDEEDGGCTISLYWSLDDPSLEAWNTLTEQQQQLAFKQALQQKINEVLGETLQETAPKAP